MRVFLSYASEDRAVAERVAAALRAADHVVFFDQASLRGGDAFHERVRDEIRRSDVFVCLLSEHAISAESYVRTELELAGERWRNPANRIIPVLLTEIPVASLPVSLQALHILSAKDDPVAGILAAVAAARRKRSATRRRWVLTAVGMMAAIVGGSQLVRWLIPGRLTLETTALELRGAGAHPWPDRFKVDGWIDNATRVETSLHSWSVQTRPDVGLEVQRQESSDDVPVAAGGRERFELSLTLPAGPVAPPDFEWQICGASTLGDACTSWRAWNPKRPAGSMTTVALPASLHRRARAIASASTGFLVVASEPNELLWLGENGVVERTVAVGGDPTAVFAGGAEVLVATRDPDAVQAWTLADGRPLWTAPFPRLEIDHGSWKEPTSTRIRDVVATPTSVWVTTDQEQGEAILAGLDRSTHEWSIPKFYDGFDFDAELLRMAASGDEVWAGNENVTPSSVHVWSDRASTTFKGHDVDLVSCADDVAPGADGGVVLRTCAGELLELNDDDGRLRIVKRLGRMLGEGEEVSDPSVWAASRLASSGSGFTLGLTRGNVGQGTTVDGQVVWMPRGGESRTILRLPETKVLDLAMTSDAVLVLLESPRRRGLVLLKLT